jgi:hypothetical protein
MIRTIQLGSATTVQGLFVRQLPCGRISVRVGKTIHTGREIQRNW